MWILETDGDALSGKKLWLRPGKKFLFGRTKAQEGQFVVNDKTISRQHLTLEVQPVKTSDFGNPRARSRILLKDLKTKIGTKLDDEWIVKDVEQELQNPENSIQIGKYEHLFRIKWVPVAFTFSFSGKEEKADPYKSLYETLGPLDIKILPTYERGVTTHLLAKKRNTSKGLQALIDGKCIVNYDTYITAIADAATPSDSGPSPLELDFDGNFPDPLQHLSPRGKEPTERPDSAYAPEPSRQDMFEGYTFVFCDRRQFDNLLAPITEGRGKALLREVVPNETTVEDFLRYVKSVAGEKGLGEFEDGSEGKGVVVVRFSPENGVGHEWFANFGNEIAIRLDHRLINQNEFLDAILGSDASVLRRPLEEVDASAPPATAASMVPPQAPSQTPSQAIQDSAPAATPVESAPMNPPPWRGRARRAITKKFQGFDDDFEPRFTSTAQSMAMDETPVEQSQSQSLFVSQYQEMEESRQSPAAVSQPTSTRKRKTPPPEEPEQDDMETLAPAAVALKKRRLADDIARRRRGESTPPPPVIGKPKTSIRVQPKKVKKEIDVLKAARLQKEKAEALAKAEREALQESLEGMDIDAIRNLVIIQEMPVSRKEPSARSKAHGQQGDRWDDRWNGRKNFKKFRHRGMEGGLQRPKVIVPLEEVKKSDFGIGDEYWLGGKEEEEERGSSGRRKKGKGKDTKDISQSQSQTQGRKPAPRRGKEKEATPVDVEESAEERLFVSQNPNEKASSDEDTPLPDVPKAATPKGQAKTQMKTQKLADKTSAAKNLPAQNQNKRMAQTTLTKTGATKKARVTREDSDDSEDELRFRFRKR